MNVAHMHWTEGGISMSWKIRNKDLKSLHKELKESIVNNELLHDRVNKAYESSFSEFIVNGVKDKGSGYHMRHYLAWLDRVLRLVVDDLAVDGMSESMTGVVFTIHPMIGNDEMSVRNMKAMYRLHMNNREYARSYLHRMISLAEEILDNQICSEEHGTRHRLLFSHADFVNMMLNCTKEDEGIYSLEIRTRASQKAIACAVVHRGEPYYFEPREMFGEVV